MAENAEPDLEPFRQALRARGDATPVRVELLAKLQTLLEQPERPQPTRDLPAFIGPYAIVRELGRGGMGIVYDALDPQLQRHVAVKVLAAGVFADDRTQDRFLREARTAASVRHDALVPVYSVESPPDQPAYLVMPLVAGPTLAAVIQSDGPMEPSVAARIVRRIADGLAAVHAAGIIHRDVKPGNVLLDATDGLAKLTDFGLAKQLDEGAITSTGTIAGTPHYLSPEQLANPDAVDARCDVYALGVTLYECLTGTPPFRGSAADVLQMIRDTEPVTLRRLIRSLPADLETICLKCLEKKPEKRYTTITDLRDDLDRFLEQKPIHARPAGRVERGVRWVQRNPWAAAVILVSLLGMVASGLGWRQAALNEHSAREAATAADTAREQEAVARKQADQQALFALNTITTLIGKSQTVADRYPGTVNLRKELAEAALADLEKLTANVNNLAGADRTAIATHMKIADAYRLLGKSKETREQGNRAVELSAKLIAAEPQDAEAHSLHGRAHWDLSNLDRYEGQLPAALEHAEAAIAALGKAHEIEPENMNTTKNLAAAFNARADVFSYQLVTGKALADHRKALVLYEELARTGKANFVQQDLAFTESRLVMTHSNRYEFDAAAPHSAAALAATLKALAFEPANAERQRTARIATLDRANFLYSAGQYADAVKYAREGLAACEPVAKLELENTTLQRDVAVGHSILGVALIGLGQLDEAPKHLDRSLSIRENLGVLAVTDLLQIGQLLLAAELRRLDYEQADKVCQRILRVFEKYPNSYTPAFVTRATAFFKSRQDAFRVMAKVNADPTVIEKQPEDLQPVLMCLLAMQRLQTGSVTQGLKYLDESHMRWPEDVTIRVNGMIYYSMAAGLETDAAEKERLLKLASQDALWLATKNPDRFPQLMDYPELLPLRGYPPFQEMLRKFFKD
ncbi:hypothetical protein BH11PLA2_BH11PLA2_40510 [soil metagenome]